MTLEDHFSTGKGSMFLCSEGSVSRSFELQSEASGFEPGCGQQGPLCLLETQAHLGAGHEKVSWQQSLEPDGWQNDGKLGRFANVKMTLQMWQLFLFLQKLPARIRGPT